MDIQTIRHCTILLLPVGIVFMSMIHAGAFGYIVTVLVSCGTVAICNPLDLIRLPRHLRWMAGAALWILIPLFVLPNGTVAIKLVCLGVSAFLIFLLSKMGRGKWNEAPVFAQSQTVDTVLSKMCKAEDKLDYSWEALAAWNGSGCSEVRSLVHQAYGLQMSEKELHGPVRIAWMHGRLTGEAYAEGEIEELERQLEEKVKELEKRNERNRTLYSENCGLSRRIQDMEQDRRKKAEAAKKELNWKEEAEKWKRRAEEARQRVDELESGVSGETAESDMQEPEKEPTLEEKQDSMLELHLDGVSIAKCGERYGVTKSMAQRWINEAKARKEDSGGKYIRVCPSQHEGSERGSADACAG